MSDPIFVGIAWFDAADDLPPYRGVAADGEEPYRHGPATDGPAPATPR